ncbi:lipid II:glycine glycyltransferase FemX [Pseudomonadota bacterium]
MMEVVHSLDSACWQHFVTSTESANVFHTEELFAVFRATENYAPHLQAVIDGDGECLALLVDTRIRVLTWLPRAFTTRSIIHGGVAYCGGDRQRDALAALLGARAAGSASPLFTEVRNHRDTHDLQLDFARFRFVYQDHLNYLIDLDRPVDDIFAGIGPRTRKHIRRARRRGAVQIREVSCREDLRSWFEVLAKTYKRAGVPLADASLFQAVMDLLVPRGMARFWVACVGDEVAACSLELPFGDTVYGWYGGVDRAFSRYLPHEALMWHILEWSASSGYRTYDFGGAGPPGGVPGIRAFKSKFGGELVNFGRYVHIPSPTRYAAASAAYGLGQRLRIWGSG